MNMSEDTLRRMGYRPLTAGESVSAAFHSLDVFQVPGFYFDRDVALSVPGEVGGSQCVAAVGTSVNALSTQLTGTAYVDDEEKWAKEHKCAPPYLMVKIGPTGSHICTHGYIAEKNGGIRTYDCFGLARAELRALKEKILPRFLTSLTCVLAPFIPLVRVIRVDSAWSGIMPDGRIVHDIRINMSLRGHTLMPVTDAEVHSLLSQAITLGNSFDVKVAHFFHLALGEDDALKKFLYFFLSIEIATHRTFARIDHVAQLGAIIRPPPRLGGTVPAFVERKVREVHDLKDRFIWCAVAAWTHVTDADVATFTRLKKVRDDIAHGRIAMPPHAAMAEVQALAAKLHRR